MKASRAAMDAAATTPRFFAMSFDDMANVVREKGLYSKTGAAVQIDGKQLHKLIQLDRLVAMENRINELVYATAKAATSEEKESTMKESIHIASFSTDTHELHYLASMLINHREVMRTLARNPHIDEKTQLILATDLELKNDRETQLGLAHNPALSAVIMAKIINTSDNIHVHQGIALNAVAKARALPHDSDYADICKQLAGSFDTIMRQTAIPGVRDPEILRKIADNNSVFLAPRELEAVASNHFTPDDVLQDLSKRSFPAVQHILSITVTDKARSTLANKQYQNELANEPVLSNLHP